MTESVGNNEIWQILNLPSKVHFCNSINITGVTKNVLTSSQVKKFSQCKLRDKKHQYFSIVSLPTDSVIVDHAVSYVILIISDVHLNFS
jgi:hypothetical protein